MQLLAPGFNTEWLVFPANGLSALIVLCLKIQCMLGMIILPPQLEHARMLLVHNMPERTRFTLLLPQVQYRSPSVLPWLWEGITQNGDLVLTPQPIVHTAGPAGGRPASVSSKSACITFSRMQIRLLQAYDCVVRVSLHTPLKGEGRGNMPDLAFICYRRALQGCKQLWLGIS